MDTRAIHLIRRHGSLKCASPFNAHIGIVIYLSIYLFDLFSIVWHNKLFLSNTRLNGALCWIQEKREHVVRSWLDGAPVWHLRDRLTMLTRSWLGPIYQVNNIDLLILSVSYSAYFPLSLHYIFKVTLRVLFVTAALQTQKAVSAYLKSKQILPFCFSWQTSGNGWWAMRLLLGQHRRRWANTNRTSGQRLLSADEPAYNITVAICHNNLYQWSTLPARDTLMRFFKLFFFFTATILTNTVK